MRRGRPFHSLAALAPAVLAEILESTEGKVETTWDPLSVQFALRAGGRRFVAVFRPAGTAAAVKSAIEQLRRARTAADRRAIPTVVAPFMGEVGRRLCAEAGVSWFDLSGNAHLRATGLFVRVEGRANRFKRAGRPANLFAPMSSRIARWFLLHPQAHLTQRELARAVDLDEGFVSRLAARLVAAELLVRGSDGRLGVANPDALLDSWDEAYDFSGHATLKGYAPARSGEESLRRLTDVFTAAGVEHAATGLAGAWLWDEYAAFRLTTIYLAAPPDRALLGRADFVEGEAGANVWLVAPNDRGVFHGAAKRRGAWCVHPVQVYLDLRAHPERAPDAAAHLRERRLRWSGDAG